MLLVVLVWPVRFKIWLMAMASASTEKDTPVECIISEYPICRDTIRELSKKWEKRTKKLNTKWPAEGTFDVTMCREMKALIKKSQD